MNKIKFRYIIYTFILLFTFGCTNNNSTNYYKKYGIVKEINIDYEYNMTTHTYSLLYIQKVVFNDTIMYIPSKNKPNIGDTIIIIKYYE